MTFLTKSSVIPPKVSQVQSSHFHVGLHRSHHRSHHHRVPLPGLVLELLLPVFTGSFSQFGGLQLASNTPSSLNRTPQKNLKMDTNKNRHIWKGILYISKALSLVLPGTCMKGTEKHFFWKCWIFALNTHLHGFLRTNTLMVPNNSCAILRTRILHQYSKYLVSSRNLFLFTSSPSPWSLQTTSRFGCQWSGLISGIPLIDWRYNQSWHFQQPFQ